LSLRGARGAKTGEDNSGRSAAKHLGEAHFLPRFVGRERLPAPGSFFVVPSNDCSNG
jgi:hypothetical protein